MRRVAMALFAAAVIASTVQAGQAKEYAYVFLQGKLADGNSGRPLARAAVRVTTESATFETLSDQRGVFVFEKLPVERLELRITTPDGRVIRAVQRGDPDDPQGTRFSLKMGRGYGAGLRITLDEKRMDVDYPAPKTRWGKLWAEVGIFVGAAGLLAL